MSKYIDPFTDFGFKRIFGQESSKRLLIGFLNALFEGDRVVSDLVYLVGLHDDNSQYKMMTENFGVATIMIRHILSQPRHDVGASTCTTRCRFMCVTKD